MAEILSLPRKSDFSSIRRRRGQRSQPLNRAGRKLAPVLIERLAIGTVEIVQAFLLLLPLAALILTPIFSPSYSKLPHHYEALESRCQSFTGSHSTPGCANPDNETVFISASLYDPDGQLVKGDWGNSVLEVIHLIGPDNVFLSIYENDGGPEEEMALAEFRDRLPCRNALVHDRNTGGATHGFPTVDLPDGSRRVKRLAYLSEIRNRALRPLDGFAQNEIRYDKVLFLNDITFRAVDAAHLLFNTNIGADGRTHYLAACGLDYFTPFLYYDTFALRDSEGYSTGVPLFPIFSTAGRGLSRAAMLAGVDAVPVASCWGGIVAMQARYLQASEEPPAHVLGAIWHDPGTDNLIHTLPVRFRYEPEPFYEACECCLLMADVHQAAERDLSLPDTDKEIFVNPYVRVAYNQRILFWQRWVQMWERLFVLPQLVLNKIAKMPKNNPYRSYKQNTRFSAEVWLGGDEHEPGHWELTQQQARNGMFCGTRKMLTMKPGQRPGNANWESHRIPEGQTLGFG